MSNLLGENFKPYVAKQIKTRQDILGRRESGVLSDSNSNEAIMWENGKTSYIALASSVDIKDSPIYKTNVSVNIEASQGFGVSTVTTSSEEGGNASFPEANSETPLPTTLLSTNPFQIEWLSAYTEEEANIEASYLLAYMKDLYGTNINGIIKVFDRIKTYKRYEQVVEAFKRLFSRKWVNGAGGVSDLNTLSTRVINVGGINNPFNRGDLDLSLVDEENEDFLADRKAQLKDDTGYAFQSSPSNSPLILEINGEMVQSPLAGQVTYIITNNPNFESPEKTVEEKLREQTTSIQDATYVDPTYAGTAIVKQLNNQITTNTTVNTEFEEIGTDGLGTKRIKESLELEGDPNQYLGNFVSRNLVLTNGTTFVSNYDKQTYKAGVANNNSTFNDFVYGFGGDKDFGLVAMPGLEGVDIKSKNMGSLREATITLRANSEKQFSLIDTVYCRIGYTMFLEWGHSVYFDNTPNYVSNPLIEGVPSLIPSFLKPKAGGTCLGPNQGIQKQIEENRAISCGNYDAFMGRVTNFSWEFDPSGYYKVTLKLASIGDIIESLGVDQPLPNALLEGNPPALGAQPSFNSALETFLSIAATPNGASVYQAGQDFGDETLTNAYDVYKRTLVANNIATETDTNDLITTSAAIAAIAAVVATGGAASAFAGAGVATASTLGAAGAGTGVIVNGALISGGVTAATVTAGAGLVAGAAVNETGLGESVVAQTETLASESSPELRYDRSKTNSAGKIISS